MIYPKPYSIYLRGNIVQQRNPFLRDRRQSASCWRTEDADTLAWRSAQEFRAWGFGFRDLGLRV